MNNQRCSPHGKSIPNRTKRNSLTPCLQKWWVFSRCITSNSQFLLANCCFFVQKSQTLRRLHTTHLRRQIQLAELQICTERKRQEQLELGRKIKLKRLRILDLELEKLESQVSHFSVKVHDCSIMCSSVLMSLCLCKRVPEITVQLQDSDWILRGDKEIKSEKITPCFHSFNVLELHWFSSLHHKGSSVNSRII